MLSRKYAAFKYLKWTMVKFVHDSPISAVYMRWSHFYNTSIARWTVHEIIHPRFTVMWGIDPTVLEETSYRLDLPKDGPCLYGCRVQIVRFCFQFWMFRRLLWDRKGKMWDFPIGETDGKAEN